MKILHSDGIAAGMNGAACTLSLFFCLEPSTLEQQSSWFQLRHGLLNAAAAAHHFAEFSSIPVLALSFASK
eukprot:CAMPEP_0174293238 /NCGR_PEP_ID=MMETSP0809-20121228/37943_1 /TAXON_ID=73025 ORGANISM="Eutreptiella gymnastica-like, Strain CCMP1594" /NCGR_SAMPLE_ID=MMETSP0809 /ASSEMBLY_ACC=CAM_ASM_000658 /LENGTH=70 /DNA_ID=CAMNT_0015393877 /DNA_START=504 /DNA_END=713 /DNA_ORIENTATION=-